MKGLCTGGSRDASPQVSGGVRPPRARSPRCRCHARARRCAEPVRRRPGSRPPPGVPEGVHRLGQQVGQPGTVLPTAGPTTGGGGVRRRNPAGRIGRPRGEALIGARERHRPRDVRAGRRHRDVRRSSRVALRRLRGVRDAVLRQQPRQRERQFVVELPSRRRRTGSDRARAQRCPGPRRSRSPEAPRLTGRSSGCGSWGAGRENASS